MISVSPVLRVLAQVAQFGTTMLVLASLGGIAGRYAWPLELFANFRVQYAVLFALCALMLLPASRFGWAAIAAIGAVSTASTIVAQIGWFSTAPAYVESLASFRLITFNVWFRNRDLRPVARYLESSGADAVILLELDRLGALALQQMLPSYRFSQIDTQPHGAVIFSRWPVLEQQFVPLCAGCVRIARAQLDWRGQQLTLLGAHLHWPIGAVAARLRTRELQALAAFARAQQGTTLVGGDFNLTPWSRYYGQFLADSGLVDCALRQGWKPTWPSAPRALGIRIDQCFASTRWRTLAVGVGPDLGSDHLPNEVSLRLTPAAEQQGLDK